MDFDVFVSFIVVGLLYVVTSGVSSIVNAVVAKMHSLDVNLKLAPIVSLFMLASSASHLFVYFFIGSEFRKAFLILIRVRPDADTVTPFHLH